MEYFETKSINVDEILSSWRMNDKEIDNYIIESRKALHLFMPSYESLNEIMDEDENRLRKLLTLNDNYFVVIDDNKIVGILTIINNNELTYVVPFKYQRRVHIITVIREIMSKYDITKTVRIDDLEGNYIEDIPHEETDYYNIELNIIKNTIDILLSKGYQKEDILNDISIYMSNKIYQKK